MNPRSLTTPLAVALATCALAPAAAMAAPVIEGQGIAAGGGPGVNAKQFEKYFESQKTQNLTAPDQVDRATPPPAAHAAAPTWPTGPQPVVTSHAPATAAPANDDGGIDTGVWIAIGGASLIAAGGVGFAGRKRVQVVRKRQPA